MRILTLSNCDLVASQGSGYVITGFIEGLRNMGHSVTALGPADCILGPATGKARSLRLAFGMWRKASSLVGKIRPDLVEFWGGEAWLAIDRMAKKSGKTYSIVARSNGVETLAAETLRAHGIHNTSDGRSPKWYQGRLALPVHRAFSRSDAVTTVSKQDADYVVSKRYQPADRVIGMDNALTDEFIGIPFADDRPKTIGFCGSWLARKGNALIARDMVHVLRQVSGWSFHLVGVGREFKADSIFPKDLLHRIVVTDFISSKAALMDVYRSWSIALMPSVYESFGLVSAEAMACGCALVASRTGFAASLADRREAVLLEGHESPALRDAVLSLVEDEPLRRSIARAGWQRVQSLRWRENISRLDSFYRTMLSSGCYGRNPQA